MKIIRPESDIQFDIPEDNWFGLAACLLDEGYSGLRLAASLRLSASRLAFSLDASRLWLAASLRRSASLFAFFA